MGNKETNVRSFFRNRYKCKGKQVIVEQVFSVWRSRQHVVICALNDEEFKIYNRLLSQALKHHKGPYPKNKSAKFRAVLEVMRKFLNEKAYSDFWINLE